MKKLVLISILSAFLITFAFSATGLTIWCSEKQVSVLQQLGNQFEKDYGISVKVQQVNFNDIKSKFLVAAPTGEGPDIIVGAHDWIGELATNGLVEPLTYLADKDKSKFFSTAINALTYNGKLYGLPYAMEAVALIYNKDYISTPPKSFEEIMQKYSDLNTGDTYAILWDANNFYFTFPLLSAEGGYVFKWENGKYNTSDIGLDNKGAIAGAKLLKELFDEGFLPSGVNYNIMDSAFKEGTVAMVITGPWAVSEYKKAGVNYGIAKLPTIDGHTPHPFVGVQAFMINAKSKNKLAAFEFLKNYATTKEAQYKLYLGDPRIPARKDVLSMIKDNPDLQAFTASAADGFPMPNVPAMGAVWGPMGDALANITSGKTSVEDALHNAVQKILSSLNKK